MCRRAGEKLFLKGDRCATPKCGIIRKPSPPGMHGSKSRRAQSEYGQQLAMKQRVKRMYAVLERQLRKYFEEVQNKPGVIGDLLMQKLEMRLDNALFRAGFAASRRQARQLAKHSLFGVNGKNVNIPSFELKVGDKVGLKQNKADKNYAKQLLAALKENKGGGAPGWLLVDPGKATIEVKSKPVHDDFGSGVDAQMVIEFYSR